MKLIILLIVPLLSGEAFRLSHLDKTHKGSVPLFALFNSISTFVNGIDTKPDSSLKHHLKTYHRKKIFTSIIPNTVFLYVHFASKPRFPNNVSVPNFGLRMMWPIIGQWSPIHSKPPSKKNRKLITLFCTSYMTSNTSISIFTFYLV